MNWKQTTIQPEVYTLWRLMRENAKTWLGACDDLALLTHEFSVSQSVASEECNDYSQNVGALAWVGISPQMRLEFDFHCNIDNFEAHKWPKLRTKIHSLLTTLYYFDLTLCWFSLHLRARDTIPLAQYLWCQFRGTEAVNFYTYI